MNLGERRCETVDAPLTILHVSIAYGWRGGQQQTLLSVQGLQRLGHRCILLTPDDSEIAERARAAGVEVAPMPIRYELDPKTLGRFRSLVGAYDPDVVHLQGPTRSYLGWYARHIARVPVTVITRRQAIRIRGPLKYRICSDRVIAVSEAVAKICRQSRLLAHYVDVAHDGVDLDRFQSRPGGGRLRAELGIEEDELLLYTSSALDPCKDLDTLLRAFHKLRALAPKCRLAIAGEGALQQTLEEQARALGLSLEGARPDVWFLGFRTDVPDLLAASDLYVQCSRAEGLGSSIIEAMAMGKPILATRAGGIPELVTENVTGRTVAMGDADAMAMVANEMLSDREELDRMGRAGNLVVHRHFSADAMVNKNLAIYRKILLAKRNGG